MWVPRGLAGFPKMLSDEGTPENVRRSEIGHLGSRAKQARGSRSRSEDVQSVPAGGVQSLELKPKRSSPIRGKIKLSRSFVRFSRNLDTNKVNGGSLVGSAGESYINKFQVYRQLRGRFQG